MDRGRVKVVDTIGKFRCRSRSFRSVPATSSKFEARGYKPVLRLDADQEVRTTRTTSWWTCTGRIDHPQELAEDLINTVGVVEHGLFLNMVDRSSSATRRPARMTNTNK
ncbi:MAG: ribose-5-phosphate isomerase A [Bifidobacterium dentium]